MACLHMAHWWAANWSITLFKVHNINEKTTQQWRWRKDNFDLQKEYFGLRHVSTCQGNCRQPASQAGWERLTPKGTMFWQSLQCAYLNAQVPNKQNIIYHINRYLEAHNYKTFFLSFFNKSKMSFLHSQCLLVACQCDHLRIILPHSFHQKLQSSAHNLNVKKIFVIILSCNSQSYAFIHCA